MAGFVLLFCLHLELMRTWNFMLLMKQKMSTNNLNETRLLSNIQAIFPYEIGHGVVSDEVEISRRCLVLK